MIYLDHRSIDLNQEEIISRLPREASFDGIKNYVNKAMKVINLASVYKPAFIEERDKNSINLGGVWFTSRVLTLNLESVERIFPYVITCGHEFDETAASMDILDRYYLDVVANTMLRLGQDKLRQIIQEKYLINKTSRMNPGSLQDWPLEQQKQLFSLLGDEDLFRQLRVSLTDSYMMLPQKTVAGLIYPTESTFESCQLCDRENCPQRRAPYDEEKVKKYFYAANS